MRWLQSLTFLFTVLMLAACGSRNTSVEPALPTNTAVPTFTSTPVGAAVGAGGGQVSTPQPQTQPAATPAAPAATATPDAPMATIGNVIMNVRGGPGTNYNVIGTAAPGQQFEITGKNPGLGDWWQINYNGQTGWLYGPLVTATNPQVVQIALVIPAPPPPTATPIPPTPVPVPTQPPAPRFPYSLVDQGQCQSKVTTFFEGVVYDRNNNFKNGVCLHIAFGGPRNTKCTGCGKPSGTWGFSPFGGPANAGTFVEIFVVNCPSSGWDDPRSRTKDFSNLTPLSEKWSMTVNQSVGCVNIAFKEN